VGNTLVRAHRANHPGFCVGYRLFSPEVIICFFPDAEPRPGVDEELIDFIRDADVLILDSQYDRAEYRQHRGWGHGSVEASVKLALRARVRKLILFHHDPTHDDRIIDGFVRHARALVRQQGGKLKVEAAREGLTLELGAH
jgi:phosphoribosyl 1,2-cyclic phosphodiesterase